MSEYIAKLGYEVDTRPLTKSERALNNVTKAGKKTEKGTKDLTREFKDFGTNASASIALVDGPLGGVSSRISSLTTVMTAGNVAITALGVGAAGLALSLSQGISQLDQYEVDLIRVEAVLKATGNAVGFTAEQLRDQADALALATLTSTTEVQKAQAALLTFNKVTGDTFTRAINLSQDLAEVGFGSINSSAVQLGKALQDPVKGLSALTRVGVTFSEQQQQQIKDLVKNNELLKAQSILLDAIESQAGGAGAAVAASSLAGSIDTLGQRWDEFTRSIAESTGALSLVKGGVDELSSSLNFGAANTEAITSAVEAATGVLVAYGAVAGGKALSSTLALQAANYSQVKIEAARTAAVVAETEAEIARLAVEKTSLAAAIKRTTSENIRNTIRTQLAANTIKLTAAEASLATAETLAGNAAAKAAIGTNALGAATRFLLGPFGLLLTAVGAAAAVYTSTTSDSEDLTKELELQRKEVDKLTESYDQLTDAGKRSAKSQLVTQLNAIRQQSIAAQTEIQNLTKNLSFQDAGGRASSNSRISELTKDIDTYKSKMTELTDEIQKLMKGDLSGGWIDALAGGDEGAEAAINKQLVALQNMRKEVGLTSDELFIFRQEQKSITNKDAPEMTAAIVKQAEEILAARKKLKSDKDSFSDLFGTDTVDLFELNQSKDYDKWLDSVVESTVTASENIQQEIKKIKENTAPTGATEKDANDSGLLTQGQAEKAIENLESQLPNPFEDFTNGAIDALTAVQSLSKQGSKEWQQLGATINTVNAGMDIFDAVKDASFSNVMGAFTSSIGAIQSIGMAFGGDDNADLYLERIESQFLDPLGKKADSISVATETTASATEKLVGINTAMLEAMQKLQANIGGAAAIIAGDMKGINFNAAPDTFEYDDISFLFDTWGAIDFIDDIIGGILGPIVNGIFGGDSKLVGQGIQIQGGNITDLAEAVNAFAYQDVSVKKNAFDDYDTYRDYQDLGSEAEMQIALVFDSLITAVATGADALGVSEEEINAAINAFEVATTDIEMKGLSPEEQAAELEAYFSEIFNDLTAEVIPWLEGFQQAGEELGETMGRVAAEVAVFDVLIRDLGVSMSSQDVNPEAYAEAADNLAMLTGGVEEFANKTSSFINNFASDATKIDIYGNALSESLGEVGLSLPATSDAIWDLMASLDASTEEGQKQIATLLNAQDTAAEYYKLIEQSSSAYRDAIDSMYDVSDAVAQMSLDAALAAARMSDLSLAGNLDLNSVQPSSSDFSTQAEFDIARAETAAKLEELAQLTEGSVTVDEQQLDTLKQIEENTKAQTDNSKQIEAMNNQIKELANIQEGQARNIALCEDYLDTIANGVINVKQVSS